MSEGFALKVSIMGGGACVKWGKGLMLVLVFKTFLAVSGEEHRLFPGNPA